MSRSRKKNVVVATQGVALRDFLVFQVKLALDGVKDFVAINLSVVAIVVDLIAGRGRRPRRFYAVVRMSRRFDRWLNLHGMKAVSEAESAEMDAPFQTDADALIGQFEELVKESGGQVLGAAAHGSKELGEPARGVKSPPRGAKSPPCGAPRS